MKPKYEQLADKLRLDLQQNKYQEGELIPSENTLQEMFQLSRHTVRQAIGILVNEGLLRKEKGSGTHVAKKETEKKRPKTIGVIMTYLSDYIFPSIIRGIEQELSQYGYSLLLGTTNNNHQKEKECLQQMLEQQVDGLIVEPTKSNEYNPNLPYYIALEEKGIPVLMINAFYEELKGPYIGVDDVKSGYLATKYLLEAKHKHLMLVTKMDDLQGKFRMQGFIQAIREAKLNFLPEDLLTYTTETKEEVVKKAIERLSQVGNQVTAIVAYNDEIANQLVEKLTEKGLQVPENISIIGNDDSTLSTSGLVNLTTLAHPKEKMGELAAKTIVQAIETGEKTTFAFEPELIERDSVKKQGTNLIEEEK